MDTKGLVKHVLHIQWGQIPLCMYVFMYSWNLFLTKHAVHLHILKVGKQAHKFWVRERARVLILPDVKSNYQCSCCIAGIFCEAKFSQNFDPVYYRKFTRKAKFPNSFIDIHQAQNKMAIVYTRDARNEDFCQVVQYCGYMDALVSGMWTRLIFCRSNSTTKTRNYTSMRKTR